MGELGEMGEMDAAAGPSEGKGRAESFARRRCLPSMWRTFMDGYWALDHEMWEVRAVILMIDSYADDTVQDAVDALSDPAITELNFVPSILQVLTTSVSPPSRALSLVHFFLTTTGYVPDSPAETTIQLLAIASTVSLSTAFSFIRSKEDALTRTALRYAVWCWMLGSPPPPHSGSAGAGVHGVQKRVIEESLHLPLLPEENAHLVHFLSHPPKTISPQAVSLLHDLVTLRLVHGGQYAESLQLDKELAGSGGKDEDRQRRREMVREFIAILPEAQRRALRIEGEALAGQREKDRSEMANGFVVPQDVDMGGSWNGVPEPPAAAAVATVRPEVPPAEPASVTATATATAQVFAPEPIRSLASSTSLSQLAQPPGSPAPQPPRTTASPFSGPPRFSQGTPTPGSPMRRVLSGSPFTPPTNTISPKGLPIPKPARKIIDDEADLVRAVTRRGKASKRLSIEPSENPASQDQEQLQAQDEDQTQHPDQDQEMMPPPPPPTMPQQQEADEAPPTPAPRRTTRRAPTSAAKVPPPPSPSTRTRKARQTTAPPQPSPLAMPGSFDAPTSPIRATSAAPGTGTRSRMTRSVSRALLDDDIEELRPTPKKARSNRKAREGTAASEATDDGVTEPGPGPTPRRSTRRGGTAQPSEGGSPTPSAAGSVVSTRSAGARTTRAREGSATPRMTRARKA